MKPTRPELPREFISAHKRRRMTDAIAELIAEQGYEATKIADIVSRAGVARKTLYDNFDGKEALLLASFESSSSELRKAVENECEEAPGEWRAKLQAGLAALLGFIEERPSDARVCMVEALSATPASAARYDAAVVRFVELLKQAAPRPGAKAMALPATTEESLVGGIAWVLQGRIRGGETAGILELLPELTEFAVSPYLNVRNQE